MSYSAEVRKIDPETVERWLGLNKRNRSLDPRTVDRYARDMEAGAWQFTGEAIKFNADGDLIDGQHRLAAIIKSGSTVECLVIDGLETVTQDVMDSGRGRTAADALKIRGEPSANHVAAVAAIALNMRGDTYMKGASKLSHTDVINWVEQNQDVHEAINMARANPIPAVPVSPWAYVLMRLRRIDENQAAKFANDLATLHTDGAGDPRAALLSRLTRAVASRETLSRHDQIMLLMRTWNAMRDGKPISKLTVISRDGQPIPIPDPH